MRVVGLVGQHVRATFWFPLHCYIPLHSASNRTRSAVKRNSVLFVPRNTDLWDLLGCELLPPNAACNAVDNCRSSVACDSGGHPKYRLRFRTVLGAGLEVKTVKGSYGVIIHRATAANCPPREDMMNLLREIPAT